MKVTLLILSEETRNGKNAKGDWTMTTLNGVDMGEKPRMKTALEVMLDKEDADLTGKLEGETIQVEITSLESGYKGAIRANGRIVRAATPAHTEPSQTRASRTASNG